MRNRLTAANNRSNITYMKSLDEIRQAVMSGKTVHWKNNLYKVIEFKGELSILCSNGSCVGIPDLINYPNDYKPEDFYMKIEERNLSMEEIRQLEKCGLLKKIDADDDDRLDDVTDNP